MFSTLVGAAGERGGGGADLGTGDTGTGGSAGAGTLMGTAGEAAGLVFGVGFPQVPPSDTLDKSPLSKVVSGIVGAGAGSGTIAGAGGA